MTKEDIIKELYGLQDKKYAAFHGSLIPTVDNDRIIGVRTPELRKLAKRLVKQGDAGVILSELPHQYLEENQLHAFIISEEKEFERCIEQTERFLPYIDNWATCDQMSPKVFKKYRQELLPFIEKWIQSGQTYTVRFAIGMLMQHYLDDCFDKTYVELVAGVKSEEYYVNMMVAWYFATALAKQYDCVIPYMEEKRLAVWTHNKTIQKSVESFRITPEQKEYLKTLKAKEIAKWSGDC